MTTSGQQPIIKSINFSELKPLEVFKYPYQASSILWGVNSSNFSDSISQIADLIKTEKTPIKMALYLIDIFSNMRVKNIAIYAQIYKKLITDFSISVTPSNQRLETLISTDFKFDGSEPQPKKIEEILDVYSKENPLYYITWDKVDELKSKFPNIDVNQEYDENL
ncbi:protein ubiquitination, partial [Trichomonas vaginalis G3]|uniref:protein ubiquitination n=1 Tax=Trichomonas vaginalis (strain ATCC PRA-98 / G3) TaxID=412133 RepID=UPI0021E5EFC3